MKDWKEGKIDWGAYEKRFRKEILNSAKAVAKLKEIKRLAEEKDVRLMCYEKNPPCHRFILIDEVIVRIEAAKTSMLALIEGQKENAREKER